MDGIKTSNEGEETTERGHHSALSSVPDQIEGLHQMCHFIQTSQPSESAAKSTFILHSQFAVSSNSSRKHHSFPRTPAANYKT